MCFWCLCVLDCPHALWSCSMARAHSRPPPEHSLSRCSETAGRVKKGLGLAVSLILRSVSEDFPPGKGTATALCPRRAVEWRVFSMRGVREWVFGNTVVKETKEIKENNN